MHWPPTTTHSSRVQSAALTAAHPASKAAAWCRGFTAWAVKFINPARISSALPAETTHAPSSAPHPPGHSAPSSTAAHTVTASTACWFSRTRVSRLPRAMCQVSSSGTQASSSMIHSRSGQPSDVEHRARSSSAFTTISAVATALTCACAVGRQPPSTTAHSPSVASQASDTRQRCVRLSQVACTDSPPKTVLFPASGETTHFPLSSAQSFTQSASGSALHRSAMLYSAAPGQRSP
mmetsp:Transcript_72130/g.192401  ORF Transcript_72130/g.192401 Transcript_72130/m.192401 type:complete len:236 (-) Transcript_72130:138-845(-)